MTASLWKRYCESLIRYEDLGVSLDCSRMNHGEGYVPSM